MSPTDTIKFQHANDTRDLCLGWGKIVEKATSGPQIHRLIFHLFDVAAMAHASLNRESRLLARITSLHGLPQEVQLRLLVFLAAAHDVGKASPGFQYLRQTKLLVILDPIWRELATHPDLGADFRVWQNAWSSENRPPNHGFLSSLALFRFFNPEFFAAGEKREPDHDLAASLLWQLSTATGFHHDKPFGERDDNLDVARFKPETAGGVHWVRLRQAMLQTLWDVLVGDGLSPTEVRDALAAYPTRQNAFWDPDFLAELLLFAGHTTVSDWIASKNGAFPFRDEVGADIDFAQYFNASLAQAGQILGELYWTGHHLCLLHDRSWSALFPEFSAPNALQQKMLDLRATMNRPTLIMVEGPMGVGKTEAALVALTAASNNDRGFFVALPTQATSNQMYERVQKFLERNLKDAPQGAQLQLVHANRFWNPDYTKTFYGDAGGFDYLFETVSRDEADDRKVVATEWAANARTGLLAEFGVGTIDSLLAAVLLVRKHYFVRFLGVYGKTIIVDEVHANDTYMDGLFTRLLAWLGRLGCHVVLLSATLPERKRREYLAAYLGEDQVTCEAQPYPRITTATRDKTSAVTAEHIPLDRSRIKRMEVRLRAVNSLEDVLHQVEADVERADRKGVFVLICSTVRFAQELYAWFRKSKVIDDAALMLHHARFVLAQRVAHDGKVTTELGKQRFKEIDEAGKARPLCILIGTSVLEQSLDYDADYLYSFPCPIDLFFQRTGRLFRRFYWFPDRELATLGTATLFHFGAIDAPDLKTCGSTFVYSEYLLLRTLRELQAALQGEQTCQLNDREHLDAMVQAVYAEVSTGRTERECQAWNHDQHAYHRDYGRAVRSLLPRAEKQRWLTEEGFRSWFSALVEQRDQGGGLIPRNATRLGDPSTQIVILVRVNEALVPLDSQGRPHPTTTLPKSGALRDKTLVRALLKSSIFLPLKHRTKLKEHLKPFKDWDHRALRGAQFLVGEWQPRHERVSFPGLRGTFYEPRRGFVEPTKYNEEA